MSPSTPHISRDDIPPPSTNDVAKPYQSLPVLSSRPLADDDGFIEEHTATDGLEPGISHPTSRGRRVSSCPPSILAPGSTRVLWDDGTPSIDWNIAVLENSADGSTLVGTPTPQPDIDPSMLLFGTLSNGVLDARGLQQQKDDAARGASMVSGSKRKRASRAVVVCRRCGADDAPKWRPGPDGPGTLCNVCGLLYARGERRKHSAGRA